MNYSIILKVGIVVLHLFLQAWHNATDLESNQYIFASGWFN